LSGPTLRFFERISNFEIDIQWIDGTKNVLADFLSRVYSATDKPEIDFVKIKKEIEEYHVILGHAGVLQLNNFLRFFMKYDSNNQKFESKNTLALVKSVVSECSICNKFNPGSQFIVKDTLVIKQPMEAIALDLGFLVPSIEGHTGFLIAMDVTSRFVQV
jgi:hypothetical protein